MCALHLTSPTPVSYIYSLCSSLCLSKYIIVQLYTSHLDCHVIHVDYLIQSNLNNPKSSFSRNYKKIVIIYISPVTKRTRFVICFHLFISNSHLNYPKKTPF